MGSAFCKDELATGEMLPQFMGQEFPPVCLFAEG